MISKNWSRFAIFITFFIHGLIFGNWVTRIPDVRNRLELTEARLGLLLLGISFGLIVTISFTGGIINRLSSKTVTVASMLVASLILPLMGWAPSYFLMWIILFAYGSAMTFMDVAMNAQAVETERLFGRPIMSSFHGAYSVGGFAGAAYGGLILEIGIQPVLHFLTVTLAVFITALFITQFYVEDTVSDQEEDVPVFKIPPRSLLPLGLIALISSIGEGTMADWTGVYLIDKLEVTESRAAFGFAIFSLTMTLGRFSGDKLTDTLSRVTILRLSSILSIIGLILSILTQNYVTMLIGFGIVGLGLSVIIPIIFSAAGNMPGYSSGVGIASVASIGYLGFLGGPPLIGFIAEYSSLSISFSIVAILMVGVFILSSQITRSEIK